VTGKLEFGGTHRAVSPAETWARIQPMFPALGITRVARVTGLDTLGIPVWVACRPNARSLSTSQGKGLSDDTAKVSGAMEALELHHAERPRIPLHLASYDELVARGVPTVDVRRLPATTAGRYHDARPVLWATARDLVTQREAWVPYETVHTSALLPAPTGSGCFLSTSNGLASGNTLEEATVHALCEVIERDAAAVWQAAADDERIARQIDLSTVADPDSRSVIETYQRHRVELVAYDITSDVGVPAVLCEIRDTSGWRASAFSGMGCHLDPSIAFLRAALEAAQSRLTYITGSRDDLNRRDYRLVESDVAAPLGTAGTRPFSDLPGPPDSRSFAGDIAVLSGRLAAVGLHDLLAVDLTLPEFDVPVVRVVVPGLEGPDDDPTYVPGQRARRARTRQGALS
jgi:YcaO-like protein with predicted kinase domain